MRSANWAGGSSCRRVPGSGAVYRWATLSSSSSFWSTTVYFLWICSETSSGALLLPLLLPLDAGNCYPFANGDSALAALTAADAANDSTVLRRAWWIGSVTKKTIMASKSSSMLLCTIAEATLDGLSATR